MTHPPPTYAASDALNALLAVQALLLAGSTLAGTVGFETKNRTGLKNRLPYRTACWLTALMVLVAVGGAAAWITVFVSERQIDTLGTGLEAAALLGPLIAIPGLGFAAARWAKPS